MLLFKTDQVISSLYEFYFSLNKLKINTKLFRKGGRESTASALTKADTMGLTFSTYTKALVPQMMNLTETVIKQALKFFI